jgi:hypothetical protein
MWGKCFQKVEFYAHERYFRPNPTRRILKLHATGVSRRAALECENLENGWVAVHEFRLQGEQPKTQREKKS